MKNLIIRDYQSTDFEQINILWIATDMGGAHRGDNQETIERTLQNGGKLIVLEESNKIIGTAWITNDSRRLYLHHFGILPEFQNQGLGKILVKESLNYAKELKLQIKLEVHKDNQIARELYKKAGFNYLGDYHVYIVRDLENI